MVGDLGQGGRRDLARDQRLRARHRPQPVEVRLDPGQPGRLQRRLQLRHRLSPRLAPHDQLGDHRVIEGADLGPRGDPGFGARTGRKNHLGQHPARRPVVLAGVFGIEPRLNRGALRLRRAGVHEPVIAGRAADHPFDQINTGDFLGDPMLDLQPGVHFQEEEIVPLGVVKKLDRPGRPVGDALPQAHGRFDQRRAGCGGQARRRSLLNDLLIAPLQRAVAFTQRDDPPRPVAEYLHLDVAGLADIAFQEHARVAEIPRRQPPHRRKGLGDARLVFADPHADAAAAGRGLEDHRKTELPSRRQRRVRVGQKVGARGQRHAARPRQLARGVLQPERPHIGRRRADEGDAGLLAGLGEGRVL
jgi:hypothetical protein